MKNERKLFFNNEEKIKAMAQMKVIETSLNEVLPNHFLKIEQNWINNNNEYREDLDINLMIKNSKMNNNYSVILFLEHIPYLTIEGLRSFEDAQNAQLIIAKLAGIEENSKISLQYITDKAMTSKEVKEEVFFDEENSFEYSDFENEMEINSYFHKMTLNRNEDNYFSNGFDLHH